MVVDRRTVLVGTTLLVSGCLSRVRDRVTGRWEKKQDVVRIYEEGIAQYNRGVQTLEAGISNEDWSVTRDRATESVTYLSTAADRFAEAEARAAEIETRRAAAFCSEANAKADLLVAMAEHVADAAEAYLQENIDEGDAYWEDYRELRAESRELRIRSSRDLSHSLGLPTE